MRLFISIDPPDEICDQLAELQFPARQVRWTASAQIHLTLAFLGDVPNQSLEDLCQQLAKVPLTPLQLTTTDIGCFRQGAVWIGLEANTALSSLQSRLSRTLQEFGLKLEQRRFHPHITLGRCKGSPADITSQLQHRLSQQRFSFQVDEIHLKSSVLSQQGAEHQIEATFFCD